VEIIRRQSGNRRRAGASSPPPKPEPQAGELERLHRERGPDSGAEVERTLKTISWKRLLLRKMKILAQKMLLRQVADCGTRTLACETPDYILDVTAPARAPGRSAKTASAVRSAGCRGSYCSPRSRIFSS